MSIIFRILLCILKIKLVLSSFCGDSAIPFSFEARPNGQPVLGCARPSCFGWTADGKPISESSSFYRVKNKPNGYLRKSLVLTYPKPIPPEFNYQPQEARCAETYDAESCNSENEWVGGIAPNIKLQKHPQALICCKYDPLSTSTGRGFALVKPGQLIMAGEVHDNFRQYAFDYISNVVKHVSENKTNLYYEVFIRRLTCLPRPSNLSSKVEGNVAVADEIIYRFSQNSDQQVSSNIRRKQISLERMQRVDEERNSEEIEGPFMGEIGDQFSIGTGQIFSRPVGADAIKEPAIPCKANDFNDNRIQGQQGIAHQIYPN